MALADSAKLVVALGLDDKGFRSGLSSANRSLGNFQSGLGQTGKGIGQLGAGVGRVATSLIRLGVAGAASVAGFVGLQLKAGVEQVKLLELATVQTEAVLKSTGGVADQTAASIRNLAEKYEGLNATLDDKVIQSGENLLLTFTNIRKDAFEPALQAALDMNQAMGGGEEGLHDTIIRLGKALQDPVRGFTSLRRVGVNITADQQKQIKTLVAQNNLYGAQQIILKELATEFGGSFAAAGNTAAGRVAALHDNVQDLQRTFAGPFAGVLDRINGKLGAFLGETGTVDAVTRLGSGIAGLFTDDAIDRGIGVLRSGLELLSPSNLAKIGQGVEGAFRFVKNIDFETIGKGLQITAGIAKTAIDAFLSLPPEVQSIAIAALAANKLSGGLLGSGVLNLAAGLGKLALGGLKTIMAGNVTVVGANVIGGPGGIPGGGLPLVAGGIPLLVPATLAAVAAAFVASQLVPRDPFLEPGGHVAPGRGFGPPSLHGRRGDLPVSDTNTQTAISKGLPPLVSEFKRSRATSEQLYALQRAETARRIGADATQLQQLYLQSGKLAAISAKDFSPKVNVNVSTTANISVSNIARSLYSFSSAASVRREFVESAL